MVQCAGAMTVTCMGSGICKTHCTCSFFWSYKCGKVSFRSISLGCVVLTFGWGVSGGWEVEESVTQFSSIVGVKSLRWCSS